MKLCHAAFVSGLFGVTALAAATAAAAGQAQYSLTLYDQPDYRGASVTFFGDNANIGSTGFAARAQSAQVRGTWRVCEGGGYRNRCEILGDNVRDLSAYGFAGRVGSAQLLAAAPVAAYAPAPYAAEPYPAAPAYQPSYTPPAYSSAAPAPIYTPPAQAYAAPPAAAYPDPAYDNAYAAEPYPAQPYAAQPYPAQTYPAQPYAAQPYPAQPYAAQAYPAPAYPAAPETATSAYPANDVGGVEGQATVYFDQPRLNGQEVSAWRPRAAEAFCRSQGLSGSVYFDASRRAASSVDPDGRPVGEGPVLSDVLCRK